MRLAALLAIPTLLLAVGLARAGEPESAQPSQAPEEAETSGSETPPPAPTPPAPTSQTTTVVAPADGPGVTVVAPTPQGGTVTASGCRSVTVTGSPTVVDASGQPLCPFKPAEPEIRYVYVDRDPRPKFAPDPGRSASIALGAVALGVGSLMLGGWYASSVSADYDQCRMDHARTVTSNGYSYSDYGSSYGGCRATGGIGPLVAYTALMSFAPTIPRFAVGANTSGWVYTAVIATSIGIGKIFDASDSSVHDVGAAGAIFGFVLPATIGIVALATTPHREDLEPKHGPSIEGVGFAPVRAPTGGTNGAMFSMTGTF
jgi:hypothetical protein